MEQEETLFKSNKSAAITNDKNEPVCLFVRCSSDNQDYQRQLNELQDLSDRNGWKVGKIIATKISGQKTYNQRQDLQELFDYIKKSKPSKIIVSEISRLGRNSKDIRSTIDFCHSNNVSIYFKNLGMESLANGQESFVINVIMAIYSELAQEETRILSQRIRSGIASSRKNKGDAFTIGRKKGVTISKDKFLKKYKNVILDLNSGLSLNKIVRIHQISKNTVIKVKRMTAIT